MDELVLETEATRTVAVGAPARFELSPGATLGRYVILKGIGAGGMGVVYKAYDKELGRNVALKILRISPDGTSTHARARLQREAQALAQLSHPNVITVYDVGSFRDNLFVAMELVEGKTLRDWLRERPSLDAIIDVFTAAARGLAAAHAVGLIHRDFKPTNVMIGKDGRVRILDFGLAREVDREDSSRQDHDERQVDTAATLSDSDSGDGARPSSVSEWLLSTHLTEFGAVVGTPAYMSPEQHRGEGIEARSDQFAYCVTLYQALYGCKPFAGKGSQQIKRNVLAGRVLPPPRTSRVPRWLHRIVMRGLEVDPERRYPCMDDLLADLGRDRGRRLRYAVMATIGLVGLSAVLVPAYLDERSDQLCRGGEQQLTAVWNDDVRAAMKRSFLATGRGHAADTHERVVNLLDDYGRRWIRAHVDACEATHKRGEQSEKVLDLRMVCLAGKLHRLETLATALVSEADARSVDEAIRAALALPGLESCDDAAALTRAYPLPAGELEKEAIQRVESMLDRIETSLDMGQTAKLMPQAQEALRLAEATGFPPAQARAHLLLGLVQVTGDRYQAAEASMQAAARTAADAHDDNRIARAWIDLVHIVGYRQGRVDDALAIVPFAETAIVRADNDALLQARLARSLGWLYATSGRFVAAQEQYERTLAILARRYGPGSAQATGSSLAISASYGLAGVLANQAKYDQAVAYYQRLREHIETTFGAEHVYMVSVLGPLAEQLSMRGEHQAAHDHYQQAIAIERQNRGTETAFMAALLAKQGENLGRMGEYEQAEHLLARAVELRFAIFGDAHLETAEVIRDLASVQLAAGRDQEAAESLEKARAVYEASSSTEHPGYAQWLVLRARLDRRRGQLEGAVERFQEALAIMEASMAGMRHPTAAEALSGLGDVAHERGDSAEALSHYREARSRLEEVYGPSHARVGEAWLATAQIHLELREYATARNHFDRARAILESAPGARAVSLARALTGLAESHMVEQPSEALRWAEHAVELWGRGRLAAADARDAAWARFVLAEVLWAQSDNRSRALRLAREAQTSLQQAPAVPEQRRRRVMVDTWLAERP
ncbi:tetratricopeptide repeat protein [Haliangium sp.]|uniref:serine/threonine-protein kinase n=1 Tax=Haliangium sp. TaxID=2663208 RepID=UPI003D12A4B2